MNTHEIDRLVAEKVMGFEYSEDWHVDFHPTEYLVHAFMVLKEFDLVDIQKTKNSYLISIHHNDEIYFAEGEGFCLQVCLAALKAVGVEVEKDD